MRCPHLTSGVCHHCHTQALKLARRDAAADVRADIRRRISELHQIPTSDKEVGFQDAIRKIEHLLKTSGQAS